MSGFAEGSVVGSAATRSRYDDTDFVSHFVVRQFGDAVDIRPGAQASVADKPMKRFHANAGSEPFYSAINSILQLVVEPNSRCVDIGCGPGRVSAELAGRLAAGRVIGIDKSEMMVGFARAIVSGAKGTFVEFNLGPARARMPALGLSNCSFLVGDAQDLPIEDESADVAVLSNVLHRVADPFRALAELHRAVSPGGHAVISNSYDWSESITPKPLWFDDVKDVIDDCEWKIRFEQDHVPYCSPVSPRKSTLAYNHLLLLTKR